MKKYELAPYQKLYFNKIFRLLIKDNRFDISQENLLKEYPILDKTEGYLIRKYLSMWFSNIINVMAYKILHIKDYVYLKINDFDIVVDENARELANSKIISINDIASYFEVPYWIGAKVYRLMDDLK